MRYDSVPAPVFGSFYLPVAKSRFHFGEAIDENLTAFDLGALLTGPGAELALPRALRKISVGFFGRNSFHLSGDVHLAMETVPKKGEARPTRCIECTTLRRSIVGVEHKTRGIDLTK